MRSVNKVFLFCFKTVTSGYGARPMLNRLIHKVCRVACGRRVTPAAINLDNATATARQFNVVS